MVKQTHDLPENNAEETLAHKLRAARDNINLSRANVHAKTGISAKSLEKYEDGSSDLPLGRLKALCNLYNISLSDLLNDGKPTENHVLGNTPHADGNNPEDITEDMISIVRNMLEQLDEYQASDFAGAPRRGMAQKSDALQVIKHLEADELLELAEERNLYMGDLPSQEELLALFERDIDKFQIACHHIENRIVDTAILGTDLHTIEKDALASLADDLREDHSIESPKMFGWGEYSDFVPVIRNQLHKLAFSEMAIDLLDKEEFPNNHDLKELRTLI